MTKDFLKTTFLTISIILGLFILTFSAISYEDFMWYMAFSLIGICIGLTGAVLAAAHKVKIGGWLLIVAALVLIPSSYFAQSFGDFYRLDLSFSIGKLIGAMILSLPFLVTGLVSLWSIRRTK